MFCISIRSLICASNWTGAHSQRAWSWRLPSSQGINTWPCSSIKYYRWSAACTCEVSCFLQCIVWCTSLGCHPSGLDSEIDHYLTKSCLPKEADSLSCLNCHPSEYLSSAIGVERLFSSGRMIFKMLFDRSQFLKPPVPQMQQTELLSVWSCATMCMVILYICILTLEVTIGPILAWLISENVPRPSFSPDRGHHISELFVSSFGNVYRKWWYSWKANIKFFLFYFILPFPCPT